MEDKEINEKRLTDIILENYNLENKHALSGFLHDANVKDILLIRCVSKRKRYEVIGRLYSKFVAPSKTMPAGIAILRPCKENPIKLEIVPYEDIASYERLNIRR